jgi:hypothetical protein
LIYEALRMRARPDGMLTLTNAHDVPGNTFPKNGTHKKTAS